MSNSFEEYCDRIENEYDNLGHELGWSFLCTPKDTLNNNSSIALITMNPGGKGHTPPVKSFEKGNVYLNEDWGRGVGIEAVQQQIKALFRHLSKEIPKYNDRYETLMKESLVGYFIPFRSPDFASLKEPEKSKIFAYNLWKDILNNTELKLIIWIDKVTFHNILRMYKTSLGYSVIEHDPTLFKSGWGTVKLELRILERNDKRIVIARFPHLSRYKLFNRGKSKQRLEVFIKKITSVFN